MNGYRAPAVWWICADCGHPLQRGQFCEDCGGKGEALLESTQIQQRLTKRDLLDTKETT